MNFELNKRKFWPCLPAGRWGRIRIYILIVIIVLSGVNIYLYFLRKSIYDFIREEVLLDAKRIEQIRTFRHKA
jgi:hypothetical protein